MQLLMSRVSRAKQNASELPMGKRKLELLKQKACPSSG